MGITSATTKNLKIMTLTKDEYEQAKESLSRRFKGYRHFIVK